MTDGDATNRDRIASVETMPRWQFGLRDLFAVTAVIAVYLAAYVLLFQCLSSNCELSQASLIRSFGMGLFGGLAPSLICVLYNRAWSQQVTGQVLAQWKRPPMRAAWTVGVCCVPLIAVIAALVIGLFAPGRDPNGRQLLWPLCTATILVLYTSMSALYALKSLLWRTTKICQNGLVIDSIHFLDWNKLEAGKSILDEKGNRIICLGLWRR